MSRLYAGLAAAALAVLVGGTAVWTTLRPDPRCGGNAIAGGNAAIGGAFELVNGSGQTLRDTDVIDGPTLVYFGYTFCPDVCPFDMARNALAVDLLKEEGYDINLAFITIDPERDTPEIVGEYAAAMHPDAIGLSGTAEQVRTAARAYKVYYAKGAGTDDSYLMDHSAFTYLMFPETGLATYFGRQVSAEEMASETACHIRAM